MGNVALTIHNIGNKIVDKKGEFYDKVKDLDRRITKAEDQFEDLIGDLMDAPPNTINLSQLNVVRGSAKTSAPGPSAMPSPVAPAATAAPSVAIPEMPSFEAPAIPATPSLSAAPPSTAPSMAAAPGPNLEAAPPSTAPSVAAAPGPDIGAPPPSGGPNLGAAPPNGGPNLGAAPPGGGLTPAPTSSPGPSSAGASSGGFDPAAVLAGLTSAPKQESKEPIAKPGVGFDPAAVLKGLTPAPKKEEEPSSSEGTGMGFNPAAALKGLTPVPKEEKPEEVKSEFVDLLEKRKKATDGRDDAAEEEEIKAPSSDEDRSKLADRLKQAFNQ